jgi:tRNA(Leu) C34 or U34 (ribose-2'-O)-methylase TrmL
MELDRPEVDLDRADAVSYRPPRGIAPAVALIFPKYGHNVGAAVRAASCFGVSQVWWTGNRVTLDAAKGERLPREERMKGYRDVQMIQYDYIFDRFDRDVTPVAVEVRPQAESLVDFVHPEKPLYVFGPEDGSLGNPQVRHCHRFVVIPTRPASISRRPSIWCSTTGWSRRASPPTPEDGVAAHSTTVETKALNFGAGGRV